MHKKLPFNDEAYLAMLCAKCSTERIARLYMTYIQLRASTGDRPPILQAMLIALYTKIKGLQQSLLNKWPDYMAEEKWHHPEEQATCLQQLSEETQADLRKICTKEIKMLQLVTLMVNKP